MKSTSSRKLALAFVLGLATASSAFAVDRDRNPPGPAGGAGTNWENKPGPRGGPGTSPDRRRDHDGNPPGPAGGAGTNWENRPGPQGGPGTSPDHRVHVRGVEYVFHPYRGGYYVNADIGYWHPLYGFWNQAGRCWNDNDSNPPGRAGGRGTNWENPPGMAGGPGASPDRYGRCR